MLWLTYTLADFFYIQFTFPSWVISINNTCVYVCVWVSVLGHSDFLLWVRLRYDTFLAQTADTHTLKQSMSMSPSLKQNNEHKTTNTPAHTPRTNTNRPPQQKQLSGALATWRQNVHFLSALLALHHLVVVSVCTG